MKKLRKGMSLLLSIMLVLTLIPSVGVGTAFAAEGTPEGSSYATQVNIRDTDSIGFVKSLSGSDLTWSESGKGSATFNPEKGELKLDGYKYNPVSAMGGDITVVLSGENTITGAQKMPEEGYSNSNGINGLSVSREGTLTIKGDDAEGKDSLTIDLTGNERASGGIYGINGKKIVIDGADVTVTINNPKYERYAVYALEGIEIKNNGKLTVNLNGGKSGHTGRAIYNQDAGDITIDNATVVVNGDANASAIYNDNGSIKIKGGSKVNLNGYKDDTSSLLGTAITVKKNDTTAAEGQKYNVVIDGEGSTLTIKNYSIAIYDRICGDSYTDLKNKGLLHGIEIGDKATLDIQFCEYGVWSDRGVKVNNAMFIAKTEWATVQEYTTTLTSPRAGLNVLGNSKVDLQAEYGGAVYAPETTAGCALFNLSSGGSVTLRSKKGPSYTIVGCLMLGENTIPDSSKYLFGTVGFSEETALPVKYLCASSEQKKWVADADGYYSMKFITDKKLTGISVAPADESVAVPNKVQGETTKQFTATGTYDDTTTAAITAEWTVATTADGTTVPTGVSIDNNGKLTITPDAAAGDVYIKAKSGELSSAAVKLTITKAAAELKELTITGPDAVAVPVATAESDNTGTYSYAGTDQYGNDIAVSGAVWSLVDAPATGVSIDPATGVLTVAKNAATTDSLKVKVTVGSVSKEKIIKITKEESVVTKVEITGIAPVLTVPEVTEISGTASTPVANTYTAKVYDQYNAVMSGKNVTWGVSGNDGVTIDASNGKLTVKNTASANSVTITATCEGKADSKTVAVVRAEEKAKFVQILRGEKAVTADSIVIPTTDTPNSVTYGFKVYDQYGKEMTGKTAVWSATGTNEKITFVGATLAVAKGAEEGTVTVKAKVNDAEGTVAVSVNNKETVEIKGISAANGTYDGSAQKGYTGTASSGKYTGALNFTYSGRGTTSYGPTATAPTKAGEYTLTVSVPADDAAYTGSKTFDFTIAKREVAVAAGGYKVSKVYDGTTDAGAASGALAVSGILAADADSVTVKAVPAAYTDANVGGQATMAVAIALEGAGKENYKIKDGAATVTVPCEITKATLTVVGTGAADAAYGAKVKDIEIRELTVKLNGAEVAGTWSFSSEDIPEVGSTAGYTATFTPTTGAGNYNVLTKEIVPTIHKVTFAGSISPVTISQKYSVNGQQTVTVVAPVSNVIKYTKGMETVDGTATVAEFSVDESGLVKYKITDGVAGAKIVLGVLVESKNYHNFIVPVVITLTEKDAQAALNITSGNAVTYGQNLNLTAEGGSGAGEVTFAIVSGGTGEATISGNVLTPTKAGTVKVQATKAGDAEYNDVNSAVVEITIAQATPTVTPKFDKVTEAGKKLSDANLTATSSVDGVMAWDDAVETEVEANKEYGWTFTPTDAVNYKTVTGKVVVWTETSGGGSGSGSGAIGGTGGAGSGSGSGSIVPPTVQEPEDDGNAAILKQIESKVSQIQFAARSTKTSKKNIKVTLKLDEDTDAAIKEIQNLGYTVKFKFYRSTKKSSGYKVAMTKTSKTYTNSKGVKGNMYYYKARVQVFDKDGNLVAQTALKQCKYAKRLWTK